MDSSSECEKSTMDNISEENYFMGDEGTSSENSFNDRVTCDSSDLPNGNKEGALLVNVDKYRSVKKNTETQNMDENNEENETIYQIKQLNRMARESESSTNGLGVMVHGINGNTGYTITSHLTNDTKISPSGDSLVQNHKKGSVEQTILDKSVYIDKISDNTIETVLDDSLSRVESMKNFLQQHENENLLDQCPYVSNDGGSLGLTEQVSENEIERLATIQSEQQDGIANEINEEEEPSCEIRQEVNLNHCDQGSEVDKNSTNHEEITEENSSLVDSFYENLSENAGNENIASPESRDIPSLKTTEEVQLDDQLEDMGKDNGLSSKSNDIALMDDEGVATENLRERTDANKKSVDLKALCEASGITDEMEEENNDDDDPGVDISMHLSVAVTEVDDVVVIDDDDQSQNKLQKTPKKSLGEGVCIIPDQVTAASIQSAWNSLTQSRKRVRSSNESDDSTEISEISGRPQRKAAKKAESQIKKIVIGSENVCGGLEDVEQLKKEVMWNCVQCGIHSSCKFMATLNDKTVYICSESCLEKIRTMVNARITSKEKGCNMQVIRKCAHCRLHRIVRYKSLSWETMDFCDEDCLSRYQTKLGSHCAKCKRSVQVVNMGKYSVRFGTNVKQFCRATCLEEFKRTLKACSYCQKDITNEPESFLAPIGDRLLFKDFCSENCMKLYNILNTNNGLPEETETCAVCNEVREVKLQLCFGDSVMQFCGQVCFSAFKYANKVGLTEKCEMCKKHFTHGAKNTVFMFYEEALRHFCCTPCINAYVLMKRKIVPCGWCKVKKYNFDMICKAVPDNDECISMCSVNCYTLSEMTKNASPVTRVKCDYCKLNSLPQYKQNMSDRTLRNFCSYSCVSTFKGKCDSKDPSSQVTPIGTPTRFNFDQNDKLPPAKGSPSAASTNSNVSKVHKNLITTTNCEIKGNSIKPLKPSSSTSEIVSTNGKIHDSVLLRPPKPIIVKNKGTLCKFPTRTMGNNTDRKESCATTETQTDDSSKILVPVPVPIYIPVPTYMYTAPCPVAIPLPIPIPVPVFIPTTKNSYKAIMEEIQKIRERTPDNPYEADLIRMAQLLADERTVEDLDDDADDTDGSTCKGEEEVPFRHTIPDTPVDLEAQLNTNTIKVDLPPPPPPMSSSNENKAVANENKTLEIGGSSDSSRNRKRQGVIRGGSNKRSKRSTSTSTVESSGGNHVSLTRPIIPMEKSDAKMCLKYTYGVNGWISWIRGKNEAIQKAGSKIRLLNENLLELTADQLNYLLIQFVKEFKKPNGTDYAPDTIYYLCLGIQHYLYDNGRLDNIFNDALYNAFNKVLDEIISKFPETYEKTQVVVTRVVEEHLWESRQLGAHSPYVLLFTLMFYNTKYFNLSTIREHEHISFSHIMKHWKRGPNQPSISSGTANGSNPPNSTGKIPNGTSCSSKNVVLRFYPPQSEIDSNAKKKKVYEQHANELDPLRCPVKLYEFYLSKCPDCMKTRNDVFYLAPERSCAPESPVWYSTTPLSRDLLDKMLNRVKLVKEINVALLTSS